jgi:hypothetical protein
MKKFIKVWSLVAAFSIVMAFSAMASSIITGGISFAGFATLDKSDFTKATSFTDFYALAGGGTGDFPPLFLALADLTPFTFYPENANTPFKFWTYTDANNIIYSFYVTGLKIDYRDKNSIVLSGSGTAYETGFDATPGSWVLSANGIGSNVVPSFSATISTVPVPPSLIILGSGLLGLVGFRRKIKK